MYSLFAKNPISYDLVKLLETDFRCSPKHRFKNVVGFDHVIASDTEEIGYLRLPGFSIEDINITVDEKKIKIAGEKKNEVPQGYSLKYTNINSEDKFELVYSSNMFDKENIKASLKDGVLELKMPYLKKEFKKINISVQ